MSGTSNDSLASILSKPPEEKWMFTEDQLQNTPSRRDKVPPAKELNYRQQAANLIQDMGQRLPVNQLTINTAIVYMHRFYIFHSFQAFSRFVMAPTALFLAAKVEEQPRKLEHVIRVCHLCLHPDKPHPDVHSDSYLKQAQQLVEHEIILLQTLGFDISIDHPHTHVVKCTQLVKASRDLSQMAYFMATNSLHLTTFCLKYKPTVVSAMCIHLSCKWSNYEIPLSSEGKAYWTYMDPSITEALLENIINEFLKILNLCPTRLRKLRNYKPSSRDGSGGSTPQSKDGQQSKPSTSKVPTANRTTSAQPATDAISRRPGSNQHPSEPQKKPTASLTIAEYKHKREKELMHNKQSGSAVPNESEKEKPSISKPASAKPAVPSAPPQRQGPPRPASVKPAVPSAQNAALQRQGHHTASNPNKPASRPGHSDGRPRTTATGHPVVKTDPQTAKHPVVKVEPQTVRHPEKVHPKAAGIHHKRPDKPHHPPPKPHPGQPSGIPGLQKPKHPTHQAHVMPQQHKEHHKMQPHHHQRPHPPSHHLKPVAAKPKELAPPRPKEPQPTETKTKPSDNSDDNLLAGVEQKVMEQMKADKARDVTSRTAESTSFTKPAQHVKPVQQQQQPHPSVKEHKSRHSMPDMPSRKELSAGRALSPSSSKAAYKALYEQYKKNPEALKQQLKQKVQSEALTEEEKQIWHKLKKEEDRQRRKRKNERHKLNRSQPVESHSNNEEGNATPGGGPLTVRIKLPPSVRAEITKSQTSASGGSGSGHQIASSSGSGSEQTVSSPSGTVSKAGRKRTHAHDSTGHSDPISAKHSRKSEGHHHQSHHSSHESKHRHRHSRSSSHHHHHSKSRHSGHKIDEAIFQQALSDAVSIVQSGHTAPSAGSAETSIPTVTLKRTGVQNGSGDSYVAHSSKHDRHKASRRSKQLGFDPAAPVSATPPEDLFDGESGELPKSGTRNFVATRNPDLSSPETGEIIDDEDQASPFRGHFSNRSNLHKDQSNNNNSSQHPEHRASTSGASGYAHHPPSLTHASHQNAELDGHKNHNNRLPPMPPLTIKPNRTEQR